MIREKIAASYDADTHWRRINAALPAHIRIASPHLAREEWHSYGRFKVHIDRWTAHHPRAAAVMVHGAGGNGRMLGPYAKLLTNIGLNVVAPDLPGYGLTIQQRKTGIRYEDWRATIASVIRTEAELGLPVILFGASMGGMLAYDAAALTGVPVGLVATCLLEPRNQDVRRAMVRWAWMAGLIEPSLCTFSSLSDSLPIPMKLVSNMGAITNLPELTKAIVDDPKAGGNWMPAGFLRTFLMAEPVVPPAKFDVCPVLLVHPEQDHWTDVSLSLTFLERLRRVKTDFKLLEDGGHFPVEQKAVEQFQQAVAEFVVGLNI